MEYFAPRNPFDDAAHMAKTVMWSKNNPVPPPDWISGLIPRTFRTYMLRSIPGLTNPAQKASYEGVLYHPNSIRYRISTLGRQIHPGTQRFDPWRVELARFDVPFGDVGIVRSLEQYLAAAGISGWSIVSTIGNPFGDADSGVQGQWFLRLSPFQGEILPWVNTLNPAPEMPGTAYSDWVDQTGIWYPAHSDSSQNIRLVVPGGFSLRAFWECGTLQVRPAVSIGLKGCTQGIYSSRSLDHMRGSW